MKPYIVPLWATLAAQAVVALIAYAPPVFAVVATADFGLAPSDLGGFVAIVFAAAMVAAAAAGGMVERFGAIRVTQGCLFLCASGIALTAAADPALAALGAALVGAGYGPMNPASSHILAKVTTPVSRPLIFSAKQTGIPLGAALAGALIPALTTSFGWREAALAAAAIGVLAGLALQPIRAAYDGDRDRTAPLHPRIAAKLRMVLSNGPLRQLSLMSLAYSAMQICFGSYFVVFLAQRAGLGLVAAGVALTVAQMSGIVGRLLWGALAERLLSARRFLALLGVLMGGAAVLTTVVEPAWPFAAILVLGALFGASAVGWTGLYLAEIVRVSSPRQSAAATGGAMSLTFSGMMLGPALFGALVGTTGGYTTAFLVAAAVALLPAAALLRPEPAPAG